MNVDDEETFLQIMVELASSQQYNFTENERNAIIAIRREMLRKNMTMMKLQKTILKMEKLNSNIEKENEQLSDNLVKKAELAKQY